MFNWFYKPTFKLFSVFLIMLSLLAVPSVGQTNSHNPLALAFAEKQRHSELAATAASEKTHTHEVGLNEETYSGHQHGHNPADHSHETKSFAAEFCYITKSAPQLWVLAPAQAKPINLNAPLERPPKLLS
ncbi:hypothetical protein E4695_16125 [Alcaligenaceae bacterium 429]|nr:hypothetical protein E4695_16125 [Alcaligenaceae bacterium 429]